MITKLLRITCLTLTASYNAILIPPQNKYITDAQPNFTNDVEITTDEVDLEVMSLEEEPSEDAHEQQYTTATYSQAKIEKTINNVKSTSLFMTAYQTTQSESNINMGDMIDTPSKKPFVLNITELKINNIDNLIVDISTKQFNYSVIVDFQTPNNPQLIETLKIYIVNGYDLSNYMYTLWDYFNKPKTALYAEDPFVYKNNLIAQIANKSDNWQVEQTTTLTFGSIIGFTSLNENGDKVQTLNKDTKIYIIQLAEYERADKTQEYRVMEPFDPMFQLDYYGGTNIASAYKQKGWYITPVNYEVIDVPDLMFTIIGMPFTFISRAFNLTLFPNTPYTINIGNIFLSLIGVLTFIFVLKVILKLKG